MPNPRHPRADALPESTRRTLPMTLLRARELVMLRFRPMLVRHGITEQQWRVLRVLGDEGPLGATEVAERASILGPSLTRIIKTLEQRAMITARRLPEDGRRVSLEIAQRGEAVLKSAREERLDIYGEFERRHGRAFLERALDVLEDLIAGELRDPPVEADGTSADSAL